MSDYDEMKTGGVAPTLKHVYGLVAAIVVLLLAGGFMFYWVGARLSEADARLSDAVGKETTIRTDEARSLDARVVALETAMTEAAKKIAGLSTTLDATRKELLAAKTDADRRFTELSAKLDDQARQAQAALDAVAKKLEETRTELTQKTDEMNATLTRVKEDSQFIIAELGKKAEKAYMRFMERKLDEKITAVDTKVDGVKGDLEQQISFTKQRIEQVVADMGQSIKKTVEEQVKIDFVPSASDKEEE